MAERLLGVETEYALGRSVGELRAGGAAPDALIAAVRARLPSLPDTSSDGVFLANGARVYVDAGGHPEYATPECSTPWELVRHVRAGERIFERAVRDVGRGAVVFRSNVDYSGAQTSWGCHESYLHRVDPRRLPAELIPHLVSRIIYTGGGGFDGFSAGIEFMLSPRTAHLPAAVSDCSTSDRGIFHTKDESLARRGWHRLHLICGESVCSDLTAWLKAGTTALVVALIEAGVRPGEAVALRDPVAAMQQIARSPEAVAEGRSGGRLTAAAIQRHYLGLAEANVRRRTMPPWADEVCWRWRCILDDLEDGAPTVATSLDWAIKRTLFREYARGQGLEPCTVDAWTRVVRHLTTELMRRGLPAQLTAERVRDAGSPLAAEVARLDERFMPEQGLRWDDLERYLTLRSRLFELDMHFGELGSRGIFTALDAAGDLTHRVDGVDDIEHAVANPPRVGRAQVRGHLVRDLAGTEPRYAATWQAVWDVETRRSVDLRDPFATEVEWEPLPERTRSRGYLAAMHHRLRAALGTHDPPGEARLVGRRRVE